MRRLRFYKEQIWERKQQLILKDIMMKIKNIKEAEKNLRILKDELEKQGPNMTQVDRERRSVLTSER